MCTACTGASGPQGTYSVEQLKADHADMTNAHNLFAFDLFQSVVQAEQEAKAKSEPKINTQSPRQNILVSPYSVALALAMTYNGADNETKEAMAKTLHVDGIALEDVNKGNEVSIDVLTNLDSSVQLSIANSLWAREGKKFKSSFLDKNQKYYKARTETLDFDKPSAVDKINQWVHKQTNGKISEILEGPIDPNTILFLINAIYFNGDWSHAFKEERTVDKPFYLPDGQTKQVSMMSLTEELEYLQKDGFEAVRLPYGNGDLGMVLFLPDEHSSLDEFLEKVTADHWQQWLDGFQKVHGAIELPRFQTEFELSLNDVLKTLGMEVAFDEVRADFSQMIDIPPIAFIADVKHKTYIDVNEKGTEAAAVTKVEIREESAPMLGFHLKFERPFFYAIHDAATDTILFMGTMMEP